MSQILPTYLCFCCAFCLNLHPSLSKNAAAAAAKSIQSCPTLCDPIDGSPPSSPFPGILQARTLEWVAISFSNAWKWKVKVKSLSPVLLLVSPWTAAYQAPPSMGFSRQEYWSGMPLPSPVQSWAVSKALTFPLSSLEINSIFFGPPMPLYFSENHTAASYTELQLCAVYLMFFDYLLFSRSVLSNSLQPHGLQHGRLPCPTLSPGVCSNSCPLSRWYHPTICLILCHPVLLLPSIFACIRVFSNESTLHIKWPKYWSFSFSISPSSEYSGLISFRMDWLDLLAVQRTLKNLL